MRERFWSNILKPLSFFVIAKGERNGETALGEEKDFRSPGSLKSLGKRMAAREDVESPRRFVGIRNMAIDFAISGIETYLFLFFYKIE